MKEALLVVNPSARGEKAKEFKEQALAKLEQFFDKVQVKETKKGGDARDFARQAARDGLDTVIVMGGDGTVNEGISGLAEEDYRPNFGFFPLGTVNDLARTLKIPLNPADAIEAFDVSKTKPLDIGKINDHYFMNVVAIGIIPEAINGVSVEEKTKFGKLAYFMSGFKNMMQSTSHDFTLTIDGQEKNLTSSTILVGLTNSIGWFETLLPDAKVDDGLLHLIYLKDGTMLQSLQALPSLVSGVSASNDNVGCLTFKEATISTRFCHLT
ncbi:diacylglycerol/lipid kinase family protein [Streptococcus sp. X13SY08]|uniref:diacylglycerol/lipid kinase family protein n=1 Tax=Streptococcus sp. X13SY08 TaxID=1676616 RepID=UPI00069DE924|nr:diacylglycerol kinase family protein [Streptococcus sp. X13SY08]